MKQGAAGGLVMMALFRSDSSATKELCVYALFNLLCDPTSRVGLMREEVRVPVALVAIAVYFFWPCAFGVWSDTLLDAATLSYRVANASSRCFTSSSRLSFGVDTCRLCGRSLGW